MHAGRRAVKAGISGVLKQAGAQEAGKAGISALRSVLLGRKARKAGISRLLRRHAASREA